MKNKCRTCGCEYEIELPIADGQETLCPQCGAINVYRKPTRIEIPVGGNGSSRRGRPSAAPAEPVSAGTAPAEPASAEMRPVSRFHVIRPGTAPSSPGSSGGNAMVDRVTVRARREARRQLFGKIGIVFKDLFWILVLIVLAIGGWKFYRMWKGSPRGTVVPPPATENAAPVESVEPRKAESPEKKPPLTARKPLTQLQPEEMGELLKGARVSYYGRLPERERMGSAEGLFALVIPYGGSVLRQYAVESSSTGVVEAVRCDEHRVVERATREECERELGRQGGFLVRSGVAYYVTRANSPKQWNPPLKAGEDFCASKAYFGNAHEICRLRGWRTEDLRFEIQLVFGEKATPVPVANGVRFGEKTPYEKFRKASGEFAKKIRARDLPKPKVRSYRQTVLLYDGATIGTKMNGVTQVPRRAPNVGGAEFMRWKRLHAEAEEQERKFRNIQSENERNMREWKRRQTADLTEEEIRRALMAATVRINRLDEVGK